MVLLNKLCVLLPPVCVRMCIWPLKQAGRPEPVAVSLLGWHRTPTQQPLAGYNLSQLRVFRAQQLFHQPVLQAHQLLWAEVQDDTTIDTGTTVWGQPISSSLVIMAVNHVRNCASPAGVRLRYGRVLTLNGGQH